MESYVDGEEVELCYTTVITNENKPAAQAAMKTEGVTTGVEASHKQEIVTHMAENFPDSEATRRWLLEHRTVFRKVRDSDRGVYSEALSTRDAAPLARLAHVGECLECALAGDNDGAR